MHLLVSKTNQRERRFCEGIVEENGRNLIKLAPGFIHFTNKHTQTHYIPGLPLYLVGWGPGEAGGREMVGASTGSRCQHQHYQPEHRRRTWKRAPPKRIGRRVPRSVRHDQRIGRRKVNSRSYRMDIPFTLKNLSLCSILTSTQKLGRYEQCRRCDGPEIEEGNAWGKKSVLLEMLYI